jgi:outer membrane lipoprotein SlyB
MVDKPVAVKNHAGNIFFLTDFGQGNTDLLSRIDTIVLFDLLGQFFGQRRHRRQGFPLAIRNDLGVNVLIATKYANSRAKVRAANLFSNSNFSPLPAYI